VLAIVLAFGVRGGAAGPERLAMVLSGTGLAPSADGTASVTRTPSGWQTNLAAPGLPHLAGRRYSEAWLENPAGIPVAVGTFNDARQVTLWAGVRPTEYPTLIVTLQRSDGNPYPSSQQRVTRTLHRAHGTHTHTVAVTRRGRTRPPAAP
jgi:hypothetical protein